MESARILREKINSPAITTGVLATGHFWPGLIEIAMRSGLDYLIIDLEHLEHDAESVATACSIGRLANFPVLIRPAAAEFTRMRLALDLGPCGLLVPYVESLETMQEVQDAAYLKPRGRRRPGGPGNAWVKDYHYDTWKTTVEDDLIILPQIESRVGLGNAGEIAAHPLTTAIAVGPYDLSADLGVCWEPTRPELQDALARIRGAGKAAGKNMWMIGDGASLAKQGYTFLCLGETTMALQLKLGEINSAAKA
jgi:4-hydroxy-2-oxoheptanedioate aldolase